MWLKVSFSIVVYLHLSFIHGLTLHNLLMFATMAVSLKLASLSDRFVSSFVLKSSKSKSSITLSSLETSYVAYFYLFWSLKSSLFKNKLPSLLIAGVDSSAMLYWCFFNLLGKLFWEFCIALPLIDWIESIMLLFFLKNWFFSYFIF